MSGILIDFQRSMQHSLQKYSLYSLKSTGEYHLYKAHRGVDSECVADCESECGQASLKDSEELIFACEGEKNARLKMAEIGRDCCGNCVATLYTS